MTSPSPGDGPRHTESRNDVSGTSHGPLVQAAAIHGGTTFHVQPAEPVGEWIAPDEIPPLTVRWARQPPTPAPRTAPAPGRAPCVRRGGTS
ncbi:hypothetical protein GCM10010231_15440 [Streptomyces sindenensis]|nr:hypothetical protein GCM10010231_15440 [Streptomyces sindenensis]